MVIVILRIFDVPYVPDIDRVEAMALGQDFWQGRATASRTNRICPKH